MDDIVTHLGIGGVFSLLLIRQFIDLVKWWRSSEEVSGVSYQQRPMVNGSYVTKNEFEKHKESVQYKDSCMGNVKFLVTKIDALNQRHEDHCANQGRQFAEVKELIRNGH
jgi:hypothetical protein